MNEAVKEAEDCISGTTSSDPNPLLKNQDNLLASINPELAYNQWAPQ